MKKTLLFCFLALLPSWAPAQTPPHCGADLYREMYAREYPELAEAAQNLEYPEMLLPRGLIVIPVVVHVVYRTAPQNISQEQIESQLTVLNDDFRAENQNLNLVPPVFQDLIADMEIEFCLASRDPEGNPATGITRTQTNKDNIGLSTDVHYFSKGGADGWNSSEYLNIWVADLGENLVGRASFPGTVPDAEDGVVVDPRYFGTTGTAVFSAPYHLGRTTVHEVGHYLNLYHPWGSGQPSCEDDDEVADTPQTSEDYLQQCPSSLQVTCGSLDMYTNYMYYTDDACMAQFTPGQKIRALVTLAGPRLGLTTSQGCQPVGVSSGREQTYSFAVRPNPSSGEVEFIFSGPKESHCLVQVFDLLGRPVYKLNIPANQPYSWTVPASIPDGIYWVRAEQEGKIVSGKWILNRM